MSTPTVKNVTEIKRKIRQLNQSSVAKEWNLRFVFAKQEATK